MKSSASSAPNERSGSPALSVVMPVHNALPHLDEAINSILSQSFGDFEFVILNDASNDGSAERLREWAACDSRIRLLEVDENLGPVQSSNMVARAAKAPIVARMDADDVSARDRLSEQAAILLSRSDLGLVASLCDLIDARGHRIRGPETWRLLRKSPMVPFAHGAIMYRRELFDAIGGYRTECEYWEDQDLITRMAARSEIFVIPKVLYSVRQTVGSTRVAADLERLEQAVDRMYSCIALQADGQPYDELLACDHVNARRLDPRVFISVGSAILWSGERPRLLGRLIKRARLRADAASLFALVWAAWASASPSTLRGFLRLFSGLRNLAARPVPSDVPVRWSPAGGG